MTYPFAKSLVNMYYDEVIRAMNRSGAERQPFFFALDYEKSEGIFVANPLEAETSLGGLCFKIGAYQVCSDSRDSARPRIETLHAESVERYHRRFDIIRRGIEHGDSFLANLTLRSPIELSSNSLLSLYNHTEARYKVLIPSRCVCFSPESFVRIASDEIATYPMKGTIDANLPDAEARLLGDYKEHCEHCTIVDLMRNDLSRVALQVRVKRFKYLDRLQTSRGDILQMSSEIVGRIEEDWHAQVGSIIDSLLPAGSISGAPKERTIELIQEAEGRKRGYYTGVCGYYDGDTLDSAVMIRFVEKCDGAFYYRSGGGITINSRAEEEYAECLQKIYLPLKQ